MKKTEEKKEKKKKKFKRRERDRKSEIEKGEKGKSTNCFIPSLVKKKKWRIYLTMIYGGFKLVPSEDGLPEQESTARWRSGRKTRW